MGGTLAAHDIRKSYGAQLVLDRVSLAVPEGARIGLVGPNGIGKSTLLRVLAGLEEVDAGRVARTPPALMVGYLPQETDGRAGETLRTYLARRTGLAAVEERMDFLAASLERQPELAAEHAEALERFLALGGEDFEARARGAALQAGVDLPLDVEVERLSGGQAARAALASILLARFDVLLLDEPTNDLDFTGLAVLERFLGALGAGVVVVSHDRAFLERTVTRMLEFEAETGRTAEFAGGWHEYELARARRRAAHEEAFQHYTAERDRFTGLLHERRGQARAAGAQADRRGTHALSSKVRSAERRIERLERVEKPWQPWQLQLSLGTRVRSGDVVARLERAVVERDGFRLGPVDLELGWQDRLAVLGPNGSGKTTLLQALLGAIPLAGGSRSIGRGVVLGELEQRRTLFDESTPLLAGFGEASKLPPEDARTLLAKFNLGAEAVLRPSSSLSPGERTRAVLALLSARGVNFLVLDEPTNHLDLEAIEELETALARYEGTVVLVTHDRRFLDAFQATRTVEL